MASTRSTRRGAARRGRARHSRLRQPHGLADLHPGEVVLDLGSGGGIDVLLSARRVGPTGKAYGLDMTDEMLALARENQPMAGVVQRRVPQGRDREHPAAGQLGRRDHQQLRGQPLGRQGPSPARGVPRSEAGQPLAISDILFQGDLSLVPDELRHDVEAWSACIAGALEEQDFLERLRRAGFAGPSVEVTNVYDGSAANSMCGAPPMPDGVRLVSGFVRATKPRG